MFKAFRAVKRVSKRLWAEVSREMSPPASELPTFLNVFEIPSDWNVEPVLNLSGCVIAFKPRRTTELAGESTKHPYSPATSRAPTLKSREKNLRFEPYPSRSILPSRSPPLPPLMRDAVTAEQKFADDSGWDGWPNGKFSCYYSHDFHRKTDRLAVHWACLGQGGHGGDEMAETKEKGRRTGRKCLGVVSCDTCDALIRPLTRKVKQQVEKPCTCGGSLIHEECGVLSVVWVFAAGVFYENSGTHHHKKPVRKLHMLPKEKKALTAVVLEHPKSGPQQLLVGAPTASGPAASVAGISSVLVNKERIKHERRRILAAAETNSGFLQAFVDFQSANPDFIRITHIQGEVIVIVMQSRFMAQRLIKASLPNADDPVEGLVSDAAHKFWRDPNTLLIITSTYEPERLFCWVPVLISYANGASATHYRLHFSELFSSVAEQCEAHNLPIDDDLFANVIDFSQAERNGFIEAYCDFWLARDPNGRDADDLTRDAESLLKGCYQHFQEAARRIKKIHAVVEPHLTDVFDNFIVDLLHATSQDAFAAAAESFIGTFPHAEPWMRWWMLPAHAQMLFPSHRVMNEELWQRLPATTNAEEAMHWKIYVSLGRNFAVLEGLKALLAFVHSFQIQFVSNKHGLPIFYGASKEPWKRTALVYGITKPNRRRAGANQNDGRAPDTAKALVGRRKSTTHASSSSALNTGNSEFQYERGYSWRANSCWLDSGLTAVASAVLRKFGDMEALFSALPSDHILKEFEQMMKNRLTMALPGYQIGGSGVLNQGRDNFRKSLVKFPRTHVNDETSMYAVFDWLLRITEPISRHQALSPEIERAISYFAIPFVHVNRCRDSDTEHLLIKSVSWKLDLQMDAKYWSTYGGKLAQWFADFVRFNRAMPIGCWRRGLGDENGHLLCSGTAISHELLLSLPLTLLVEFMDSAQNPWDCPKTLSIFSNDTVASAYGLRYSITSNVYFHPTKRHFITRYISPSADGQLRVYDHDGMQSQGNAVLNTIVNPTSTLKGILTGPSDQLKDLPKGYQLWAVTYHLDGGETAQKYFIQQQISRISDKMSLHFEQRIGTLTGIPLRCLTAAAKYRQLSVSERSKWGGNDTRALEYTTQASPRKSAGKSRSKIKDVPSAPAPHFPSVSPSSDSVILPHISSLIEEQINKQDAPNSISPRLPSPTMSVVEQPSIDLIPRITVEGRIDCPVCGMHEELDTDNRRNAVQCRNCEVYAHFPCVARTVPGSSDNWTCPDCLPSYVEIPDCDQRFLDYPDEIHLLPAVVPFGRGTKWVPALFVDFDANREDREYYFRCAPGTLWEEIGSAEFFYLSASVWNRDIRQSLPPFADQLARVALPKCFEPALPDTDEGRPPFDPTLSRLFTIATPLIRSLITTGMDQSNFTHPVLRHFEEYFQIREYTSRRASDWLELASGFISAPALEEMIEPALADLGRTLPKDKETFRLLFGPAIVLFRLLAVQYTLGEPFNLNGDTFTDIHSGNLVSNSPPGLDVLQAMWITHRNSGSITAGNESFIRSHTRFDSSKQLTFFRRIRPNPSPTIEIPIIHDGLQISLPGDISPPRIDLSLPPGPRPLPKPTVKRRTVHASNSVDVLLVESAGQQSDGGDDAQEKPKKKTKFVIKPTPPGARRSERNRQSKNK